MVFSERRLAIYPSSSKLVVHILEEKSILIGVGCKHRDQAYVLSRYIIEEIKKRTPIWKKEHYENQDSEWLKGTTIEAN